MQRPAYLEHKEFRYLKVAGVLVVVAMLGYWLTKPSTGDPYGGTWFGYVLGIVSALIVLAGAVYGIRKYRTPRVVDQRRRNRRKPVYVERPVATNRRIAERRQKRADTHWRYGGTLQGWLAAHVSLGAAVALLATLHTGFRFSWNVHTLAYVLLMLMVVTGVYGAFAYLRYPALITETFGEETLSSLLMKIAELDELARVRALELPDEVNALVSRARLETPIGGNVLDQLGYREYFCPTAFAIYRLQELAKELVDGDQPKLVRDLHAVLLKKQQLLGRARKGISLSARMQFWLYLHAPLSIALLAALLAHVLAILVYW